MTARQVHAARRGVLEDPDNAPPRSVDLFDMFGRAARPPIDDGGWDYDEDDDAPEDVDERTAVAVRLARVALAVGWLPHALHKELELSGRPELTLCGVVLDAFDQAWGPVGVFRAMTQHLED